MDFENYKDLFKNSKKSKKAYDDWLSESIKILLSYYENIKDEITASDNEAKAAIYEARMLYAKGWDNSKAKQKFEQAEAASFKISEKAAEALAKDMDPEILSMLAYAGSCFWHEPIRNLASIQKDFCIKNKEPVTFASSTTAHIILDPTNPRYKAPNQKILLQEATPDQCMELERRLNLSSIATLARHKKDYSEFGKFQKDLFVNSANKLIADEKLKNAALNWDTLSKEDMQKIAEKTRDIIIEEAKKLKPDTFSNMPDVKIDLVTKGDNNGILLKANETKDALEEANIVLLNHTNSFYNLFIGTAHEVIHALQFQELMTKLNDPASNPYYAEQAKIAGLHAEGFSDNPQITCGGPSQNPAIWRDYQTHLTEYEANAFVEALNSAVASAWNIHDMMKYDHNRTEGSTERSKELIDMFNKQQAEAKKDLPLADQIKYAVGAAGGSKGESEPSNGKYARLPQPQESVAELGNELIDKGLARKRAASNAKFRQKTHQ